jgi:3-deoxy-manno-octulosonate cytidylyltransferase (CMP-KDO synthetase)
VKTTAIIPARYSSTRLPGKPLIEIKGKPLIQYVYERVKGSSVQQVVVATDDERIAAAVHGFGGEAVLTSPHHRSGTERVAEVARRMESDIVVSFAPILRDPSIMVTTLITPLLHGADLYNSHVVKVVVDHDGFALYFSRSPLPYPRKGLEKAGDEPLKEIERVKQLNKKELRGAWQHIGLYAFRRDFLLKLTALPPSTLEQQEGLEQLRILENGYEIKTVVCSSPSIGIDTPEDVERFRSLL